MLGVDMKLGKLDFAAAKDNLELVAAPVAKAVTDNELADVLAVEIEPGLADTAAFCEHYAIGLDISANCIVIEAKRAERVWYAALIVLATSRADVNGIVRKHLDAKKVSFAPMDKAVALTGMEYGGITPIGLPADWPILVDSAVAKTSHAVIGSGLRKSKLLVPGSLFKELPNAVVMDIAQTQ
jgi:prolyl-tRNA editing enzyme YbaK/EbsC (Cys-tRNA(Pro) deacylase)